MEPVSEFSPDEHRRARQAIRRLRIVIYGGVIVLALGVIALRVHAADADDAELFPGPTSRWWEGRTEQGLPVSVLIDHDGSPKSYRLDFTRRCTFGPVPDALGRRVDTNRLRKHVGRGRMDARGSEEWTVEGDVGFSRTTRVVLQNVEGGVDGWYVADEAWRQGGRQLGTCSTGRVGFRVATTERPR